MVTLLMLMAGAVADDAVAPISGEAAYALHCRTCHGARGDGRGLAGRTLSPPPRDFTQAAFWEGNDVTTEAGRIRRE